MKVSIILPTYNERKNLQTITERIFKVFKANKIDGEIVVVDDNSPDGTGLVAKKLARKYKKIQVLQRRGKLGLASAVLDGFKIAHGDVLGVMDADLSHPPEIIPQLLQPIKIGEADFVIGSRYVHGGGIKGWKLKRKLISRGATFLAHILTKVKDPLSGFFFIRKTAIEGIEFNPHGYKIALEFIIKANYKKLIEVPYTFTNRKAEESKLNFQEYINYLRHWIDLFSYKKPTISQFIKFCIVGSLGTIINLLILYTLVEFFNVWYIFSAIVAFVVALTNNFILNRLWTFKSYSKEKKTIATQYTKFLIIGIIALGVNLFVLYILVEHFHLWYMLAQFLAVLVATCANFFGSKLWVFVKK